MADPLKDWEAIAIDIREMGRAARNMAKYLEQTAQRLDLFGQGLLAVAKSIEDKINQVNEKDKDNVE